MPIKRLDHYSIRTTDVDATERFYTSVLGFERGPRPNFPFPGVWLYHDGIAVVHVVGVDMNDLEGLKDYLGDKPIDGVAGTGTIDHVAFVGSDVEAMRTKLTAMGMAHRNKTVPMANLEQVFVDDPNGVTIELNFPNV